MNMLIKHKFKLLFLSLVIIFIALQKIPFLEGDKIYEKGGFEDIYIGSHKQQVFAVVAKKYQCKRCVISVIKKSNAENYRNITAKDILANQWSKHLNEMESISSELLESDRWQIRLSNLHVDVLEFWFTNDKLIVIKRSRWVFERP